jgi:hypothetical protein
MATAQQLTHGWVPLPGGVNARSAAAAFTAGCPFELGSCTGTTSSLFFLHLKKTFLGAKFGETFLVGERSAIDKGCQVVVDIHLCWFDESCL